jgi:hypothetical protein
MRNVDLQMSISAVLSESAQDSTSTFRRSATSAYSDLKREEIDSPEDLLQMNGNRRVAQIIHLRPEALAAYKECHANVWPEVLQQIHDCNMRNCKSTTNRF